MMVAFVAAAVSCKKSEQPIEVPKDEKKETEKPVVKQLTAAELAAADAGLTFTVVSNTMIRETAAWNGFTDIHGYAGNLYIVYREATSHTSSDGKIRVLRYNTTTFQWDGIKLLSYTPPSPYTAGDLRDPKLSTTPDGRLMMTVAATLHGGPSGIKTHSMTYFSTDGVNWGTPYVLGTAGLGWYWRTEWYNGVAYNFEYESGGIKLWSSTTGTSFTNQVGPTHTFNGNYANETGFCFNPGNNNGRMIAVARLDGPNDLSAKVGVSDPPYTTINWYNAGIRVGSPDVFRMTNGTIIAAIRRDNGNTEYPAIFLVHSATPGQMTEMVRFVSGDGNDCGYPGIWQYGSQLWVSYYSSHGGGNKARIYLAKLNYTY